MTRGSKVEVACECCGVRFEARVADRKRGWGRYCSKSCKAKIQELKTGQYAKFKHGNNFAEYDRNGQPLFFAPPHCQD